LAASAIQAPAFLEAAKAESLTIPLPREDISEFSAAINRAIELRHLADAAEGGDNEEQDTAALIELLYETDADRNAAAMMLAADIRAAHAINSKSWCVTNPAETQLIRLNVGVARSDHRRPGRRDETDLRWQSGSELPRGAEQIDALG
jgi:phosphoglycolate phosphatase-like HAD superfamily hydrolase